MQTTLHKPGRLVKYRNREWMVLPSDDEELTVLKPLGGSDEEITAVYHALQLPGEEIKEARFPLPAPDDLGAFETAKLLFDASRLSFRNASGPFRCMGKLSFRPRAYQMVPLTLALKQEPVRLLNADDVGIGKTVEALIILRELMERGDVKRFAVIAPPHLCDQWQKELKDKLDIDASIIRSSTAASLDRKLPDDRSVFYHLPHQVISIDYLKSDKRKSIFLNDCPELVIVDETHTCTLPEGATSKSQQQRHALIHDLSSDKNRHLLLLTATPHSGKDSEFLSLLGLLNREFGTYDFENIDRNQRRKIARHYIQRKRDNIRRWMHEVTPFPERETKEIAYKLHQDYSSFYNEVLQFARGISRKGDNSNTARIRYWAALALLRGVMSSPAAGYAMLQKRESKLDEEELTEIQQQPNPVFDNEEKAVDEGPSNLMDNTELEEDERATLQSLSQSILALKGTATDKKAETALKYVHEWIKEGYHPLVFCKYIATAKYLGEVLKEHLPKKYDVQVVTSELADEQRREKVEALGESPYRVLVATDCLSEGINLQEYFTAVLHYDLPWNPNRIEQRDGRVDRFGQTAKEVKSYLLWGENNPIDKTVLNVLIRKVRDIRKATGISLPLGENAESIMDEVLNEVILKEKSNGQQLAMFAEEEISNELETAKRKAEQLKSIFAHESVNPESIEKDLQEVDEAIGDISTVEHFVNQSLIHLGAHVEKDSEGFVLYPQNLPPHLKSHFGNNRRKVFISYESPTPKGYRYIGRNHQFVEQLCQFMLALAFDGHPEYHNLARVSVIQTGEVAVKTTLIMFRVRNVIKEVRSNKEVVAEEMYLWGYESSGENSKTLSYEDAKDLLQHARSIANLSPERQKQDIATELGHFDRLQPKFKELATERAEKLVEAHGRFKELVGGRRYEKATPVLPPDVMGVYVLIPEPKLNI